ncbi:hypothetical protein KFK09_011671 [Dendrobium nobile]|uniref:Uncharacterized protein n=1 Tax=Dendrobium nobile TaxID=94219 RepID=A0A8T3BF62_DENNO|nr:hypothetical protein KFK09_011671 [Dendrobium nobile]
MMASRPSSDVRTGGRPEVRLRAGGYRLSPEFARTDGRDDLGSWGNTLGGQKNSGSNSKLPGIEWRGLGSSTLFSRLLRARTAEIELEGAQIDAKWKGAPSQRAREPQASEPQPLEGFGSGMSRGTIGACSPLVPTAASRSLGRVDQGRSMGTCWS